MIPVGFPISVLFLVQLDLCHKHPVSLRCVFPFNSNLYFHKHTHLEGYISKRKLRLSVGKYCGIYRRVNIFDFIKVDLYRKNVTFF